MPRKEFESFTRLDASDVNTFLMDQSVMSFAGTAARGSAIPSPVEGMYTHLEDTDRLEFWNGSAWRTPFGSTLIASQDYSAQTQLLFDSLFTTEFDTYQVFISATGTTTAGFSLQFRQSGSNIATSTYSHQFTDFQGAGTFLAQQINQTTCTYGNVRSSPGRAMSKITIMNPMNASSSTSYQIDHFDNIVSTGWVWGQNTTSSSAAFDGLRISIGNGTITGNITIYGMRK
jgi:hypothetical protein